MGLERQSNSGSHSTGRGAFSIEPKLENLTEVAGVVEMWNRVKELAARRLSQGLEDIDRGISWHLRGGKYFFGRFGSDLLLRHRWCFIVGCNNSGTSLLQSILERSGKVSVMQFEGQRYTRVLRRDTRRGYERVWSEYLSDLRLTERDPTDGVLRLAHDWMREYPLPLCNIFVEKTPVNSVRMRWLQKAFPNSVFLGLVRDGFAVTAGIKRKGKRSVGRGARHWNLVNRTMLEDGKQIDKFYIIKYEDLVENSEATAAKLENILGLDRGSLAGSMRGRYDFSTVRGEGRQPVVNLNRESIDELSDEEVRVIEKEACEMLAALGYVSPRAMAAGGR